MGLVGFGARGAFTHTALIPTWFGLALCAGGLLAISPSESRRKIFMHINVTVGLLGLIGAIAAALQGYGHARSLGVDPDYIALAAKLAMAVLLLIYVNLCVRSFIQARRSHSTGNNSWEQCAAEDWEWACVPSARRTARGARCRRRPAQEKGRLPEGDAGDLEAGAAAEVAAAAGPCAGGHQSRCGPDAAIRGSRPFVNLVLRKHESDKLMPLVIAVLVATIIQSITSFSNTQLLSKAAQRMIADLRQRGAAACGSPFGQLL